VVRVVVVGAGASARDLIKRLGDTWSIVVIDTDPERFDVISGMRDVDTVLGLIGSATTSEGFILVLAELGLFLLMFLAGFEIDFDALEREGKGPIVFGLGFFVLIVVISWFGLGLVGLETTYQQIFLTLLISAASVGSSCLHCGQPVVRPRVRAS
jgi:hypothetical protein